MTDGLRSLHLLIQMIIVADEGRTLDLNPLTVDNGFTYDVFSPWEYCPTGTYAAGFRLRVCQRIKNIRYEISDLYFVLGIFSDNV